MNNKQIARKLLRIAKILVSREATEYNQQKVLLKNIHEGSKITIGFRRENTSPIKKRKHIVAKSWDGKRVYLEPSTKPKRGQMPSEMMGSITDYGNEFYYQPTMRTQVQKVVTLEV